MYDRNKDFESLCDSIDTHCFTGDTLFDPEMISVFEEYLGRWGRVLTSQKELMSEIESQENNKIVKD